MVVFICWIILSFEMIHSKAMKHSEQDVWLTLQTASWRESRHLRVTEVKMKAILASRCLYVYVFSHFLSLPFHVFTNWPYALGYEALQQGWEALSKSCSKKEQCAFCSVLALQFLRVSIDFLTTFFYQNVPIWRYCNKIELFCPFSTTKPRNFRERDS